MYILVQANITSLLTTWWYSNYAFCSQFYEPEALLSDPADGRIFIELLGE